MTNQAITFDFHNTLAECSEWFELEVRRLPSAFLAWRDKQSGQATPANVCSNADQRYRELRLEIIDHGNELTAEECLRAVFSDMGLPAERAELEEGVRVLMRSALATSIPIPGAVETVQDIHSSGVPLGVISSAVYHPFLIWSLEKFGILDAFQHVITSASAGFYKSRPELYFHAADLLSVAPNNVVHVGDSLRFDVGGAQRAGMGTVWLRHDGQSRDDTSPVPDLTLGSLHTSAPEILHLLSSRTSHKHDVASK